MRKIPLFLLAIAALLAGCASPVADPSRVPEANRVAPKTAPKRVSSLPVLFLVGDSTVYNVAPGKVGWGNVISNQFDLSRIRVRNHAKPGRSSRTFISQGWWRQLLSEARPGDFVMIQMGHNDSSPINDTSRSRGTLPGVGNESTNFVNGLTRQRETVHTYGWYLRRYISDARAKGMIPILCTPVSRLPKPGKELDTTRYAAWAREVAAAEDVPLIDLNQRALECWGAKPVEEVYQMYFAKTDSTHFNLTGARLNARCVVEGIRALKNCPLSNYLLEQN